MCVWNFFGITCLDSYLTSHELKFAISTDKYKVHNPTLLYNVDHFTSSLYLGIYENNLFQQNLTQYLNSLCICHFGLTTMS